MFLYKRENLKGGAAKCNYFVYRDTKFVSAKNEELWGIKECEMDRCSYCKYRTVPKIEDGCI